MALAEIKEKFRGLEQEEKQSQEPASQDVQDETAGILLEVQELKKKVGEAAERVNKYERMRNNLKNELHAKLLPQLEDLREAAGESAILACRGRLETAAAKKARSQDALKAIESRLAEVADDLEGCIDAVHELSPRYHAS